jgi:transcriptional regulator with XRE-family HTH domain
MAQCLTPKGAILTSSKTTNERTAQSPATQEPVNPALCIDIKAINKKVGQAIARQRINANMTQAMVASQLEIEPESVSRLETGVFSPSLERLAQFATLFNCPIDTFLRDENENLNELAISLANIINPLGLENRSLTMKFLSDFIYFAKNFSYSCSSTKK